MTLRDSLRAHTRDHHERIERTLNLPDSVRSRTEYVRLLSAFYGFYAPHETQLQRHDRSLADIDVDLSMRLKARKLMHDLRGLGMRDADIAELPVCRRLPALPSWPQALGSMYVLEGATLGGRVIAQALRARLLLDPASQMSFLLAYGSQASAMWNAFTGRLNTLDLPSHLQTCALEGAAATFDALERWMSSVWRTT